MPDRDFAAFTTKIENSHTPVRDPQRVVLAILAAVNANDFEGLHAHFTADAELHIHGFPASEGTWRGRENVVKAIQSNFGMITEQRPEVESIVHQHDALAIRVHETGLLKSGSRRYEANGVIWFTFDGEQVRRIEEFFHTVIQG